MFAVLGLKKYGNHIYEKFDNLVDARTFYLSMVVDSNVYECGVFDESDLKTSWIFHNCKEENLLCD